MRGYFGKLPATGDFVSGGIGGATRGHLDRFATLHLARSEGPWPDGGLRALLAAPEGPALLICAIDSRDAAGRRFPLIACVPGDGVALEDADTWADAVFPLLAGALADGTPPTALGEALAAVAAPATDTETGHSAAWRRGGPPVEIDGDLPAAVSSA